MIHRPEIWRSGYGSKHERFNVSFNGETIVEAARDPEFTACRELAAQGITGKVETYFPGEDKHRIRMDIAKGVGLTTEDTRCLKIRKWQPFSQKPKHWATAANGSGN